MYSRNEAKTRRQFLKDGLRACVLGGFVFTGLSLVKRGEMNSQTGTVCAVNLPCKSCSKLDRCKEPLAKEERKNRIRSRSIE